MENLTWEMVVTVLVAVLGSQGLWAFLEHKLMQPKEFEKSVDGRFKTVDEKLDNINDKIDTVSVEINDVNTKVDFNKADEMRHNILRFDSELRRNLDHTWEEWNEILREVDDYDTFCQSTDGYPNTVAEEAMKNIREKHDLCAQKRNFI